MARSCGHNPCSALVLKILVSVVRFHPRPPRTSLPQRQSIVIGVVVSGISMPRRLSMSTSLIHQYSTASSCVQAGSGQRSIVRETAVREVSRKEGETFTQRIKGRILSAGLVHQCERIIGLTSVQSNLHRLRIIATACLYRASGLAGGGRRLRDSSQTPQRPIRCNPNQG
jgi:hypothetical protein